MTREKIQTLLNTPMTFIRKVDAAELDHVFKNLDSFIKHFPGEFHLVEDLKKKMEQLILSIAFKYISIFKAEKSMD